MLFLISILIGVVYSSCRYFHSIFSSSTQVSFSLQSNGKYSGCFKVDTNLPIILRTTPYKKKSSKSKHANSGETEDEDESALQFGKAKLTTNNDKDCRLENIYDTCHFDQQSEEEFNFEIKCRQGPCKANVDLVQIKAQNLNEEEIELNQDEDIHLVNFRVPKNFERVVISIKSETLIIVEGSMNADFFGYDPAITKSETRINALYSSKDEKLCKECTIPIIITTQGIITVRIRLMKYVENNELEIDKQYVDVVDGGNLYKLKLDQEQIVFQLKNLSGSQKIVKIYENQYQGKPIQESMIEDQIGEFIINNNININNNNNNNIYYFYVSGYNVGSYQMKITQQNIDYHEIGVEQIEIQKLKQNQVQNYLLKTEKSNKIITLNLIRVTGYSVIEYKECDQCVGYQKIKENKEQSQYITFENSCKSVNDNNQCQYMIGVGCTYIDCQYQLSIYEEQDNIQIYANQPHQSEIEEEEKHYYVFYLENAQDIQSLIFRVSSPNVLLMVSRNCKFVNWECKQYSGTNAHAINIQGKKKKEGNYYITVEGMDKSIYTITAELQQGQDIKVIPLQNGQVYHSSVSTKIEQQCFSYYQRSKSLINISMHGPNHKLVMYANPDDTLPSEQDYEMKSFNTPIQFIAQEARVCVQPLVLSFTQDPTQHNKNYTEHQEWMNENSYSELTFTIVIFNENAIVSLDWNQPYHGTLAFNQSQKFSFLTYIDEDYIYITKNVLTMGQDRDSLNIFIGDTAYESSDEYELQFVDHDSSTYVLDVDRTKELCKEGAAVYQDQNDLWSCEVFLLVKSTSLKPIRYTLTVHKRDLAIEIVEGSQYQYNLEHVLDPDGEKGEGQMLFYFKPTTNIHDINVFSSSLYGRMKMTLNLWRFDEMVHKSEWPFKSDDTSYQSEHYNQIHKAITKSSLEECWPNCLLLISIQHLEDPMVDKYAEILNNRYEILYDDQFTLLVTQGFQEIIENQKIEFTLNSDQIKYFIFKNLDRFKDDTNLVFNLMSFIGNGYFLITVNHQDNMTIPDIKDGRYDFHSDGQYLQIRKSEFINSLAKKNIPISEAYLIIAIGGFSSYWQKEQQFSNFKLEFSLMYLNMDVMSIYHSIPHEFRVLPNKKLISQYYNYIYSDIKFRIHRTTSYGTIAIWTCQPPNSIDDCTNEMSSAAPIKKIEAIGSSNSQITISVNDKGYCFYCTYLLEIEAFETEMNGQITVLISDDYVRLLSGQLYEDSLNKEEKGLYSLGVDSNTILQIIIKVSVGNPTAFISNYHKVVPSNQYRCENNLIVINILPSTLFQEDDSSIEFVHDEVFLTIDSGNADTNYTIIYHIGSIGGNLQDGKIHTLILSSIMQQATFIYENYYLDQAPLLQIALFNNTKSEDFSISLNFVEKFQRDDYSFSNVKENVSLPIKIRHPTSVTYELPKTQGLFEICIQNIMIHPNITYTRDEDKIYLEMSVSLRDIYILPQNRQYNGLILGGKSNVNYFESLIPINGYMILEISTCQTEINVGYSQNTTTFLEEDFDESFNISHNAYYTYPAKVEKGTLWIAIHNLQRNDAYYQINTHFYESRRLIPFGKMKPGKEGEIQWEIDKQKVDQIKIKFYHVECPSCQQLDNIQIDYHIYVAQDQEKLTMFGYCSHEQINGQMDSNDIVQREPIQSYKLAENSEFVEYEIKFPKLVTYQFASVGVMATIDKFMNQTNQIKVFYSPVEVPVPNYLAKLLHRNHTFFSVIVIGLIILIFLLSVWLCYYIGKYREKSSELIEQKRIAGLHKVPQNDDACFQNDIKMKYENLEEDN